VSARLVMLVDVPPPLADAVASAFDEHEAARLLPVNGGGNAITLAHGDPPELVVLGPSMDWNDVIRVVEELRGHAVLSHTVSLALVPASAVDFLAAGFAAGLGDAVPAPHPPALVRERVRALLDARRARLLLARQDAELKRLRESQQGITDHLATVLTELMEAHEPGSSGRSQRMADLAMRVAARFEVPETLQRDLWLAARMCDLGHLAAANASCLLPGAPAHEAWSHAPLTAALLARFPGFEGASELVHSIGENWDGTGHPDRFMQGQIPLRSRILRVLHDFFAAIEAGRSRGLDADSVLERMAERAGTLYDPMVLIELRAELEGLTGDRLRGDRRLVPVPELEPGMVLAEDLHADSGVKLLARGTTLSAAALEFLQRRHRAEPILHPAVVKQANAA
jgi:response regulator RpfG family c-di-GMP phosphodiesterase